MTQRIASARNGVRLVREVLFPPIEKLQRSPVVDRREFWELLKVYFSAVTILSAMIAAAAFLFQQVSIRNEYEWRRMKEAQDILKDWDRRTGPNKAAIEAYFCRKHGWTDMQAITREDALSLEDRLGTEEMLKIRAGVVELLNYFETISTAAAYKIASEAILRESLGSQMVRWRDYLREFTELVDRKNGEPAWGPYYSMVERWRKPAGTAETPAPGAKKRPSHDMGTIDRR